jgi:carbamoyltransferase
LIGHAYAAAGQHFGPYKRDVHSLIATDLGVAGKLMAYIALGAPSSEIVGKLNSLFEEYFLSDSEYAQKYRSEVVGKGMGIEPSLPYLHEFLDTCASALQGEDEDDILASFHVFLERLLVSSLEAAVREHSRGDSPRFLCISGGCALNIKWNSAIRSAGIFDDVWVPPFPNDSGSAIGAACCAMISKNGVGPLEWSVYRGPPLLNGGGAPSGWRAEPCDLADLAVKLAAGEPVVFLSGRAELGPRALGSRSLLASATSHEMKDLLNDLKLRERFRPVAPICLEDRASEIFIPGSPDPYMLFDHQTRADWQSKIPAIVHLDGSARLQTVNRHDDLDIARLLVAYERLTGIPLLCNTSANYHGRGFFPDVASACEWGKISLVWSDGILYSQEASLVPNLDISALEPALDAVATHGSSFTVKGSGPPRAALNGEHR